MECISFLRHRLSMTTSCRNPWRISPIDRTLGAMLLCGLLSGAQAEECSRWQTIKLESLPDWYELVDHRPAPVGTKSGESTPLTTYTVDITYRIDHYQLPITEVDTAVNGAPFISPGSLYLVTNDSVILVDSSIAGFSRLSFDADSTKFAVIKGRTLGDDGSLGELYIYNIGTMKGDLLAARLGGLPVTEPVFSPAASRYLAYADWGDLYIVDMLDFYLAGEPVFIRGGGYAQATECAYRGISDIRWAPDGKSLIFRYWPNVFEADFEYYEISRSSRR